MATEPQPDAPALRIVFDGESAGQPVISRVSRECGMDINILSANIRQLSGKSYGQMLIALPPTASERERLTAALQACGLTLEEVQPE